MKKVFVCAAFAISVCSCSGDNGSSAGSVSDTLVTNTDNNGTGGTGINDTTNAGNGNDTLTTTNPSGIRTDTGGIRR